MSPPARSRPSFQALIAGAAALVTLILAIAGARTWRDLAAVKHRESEIHERIEGADRRIEGLENRIESLRDDPATLERLAREELGLVKPDDVVILLPPEDETPATSARQGEDPG